MTVFCTELKAINHYTDTLEWYAGPNVLAPSWDLAQQWCEQNGKGYLLVTGILESEGPLDENGNPDFANEIDYTKIQLN